MTQLIQKTLLALSMAFLTTVVMLPFAAERSAEVVIDLGEYQMSCMGDELVVQDRMMLSVGSEFGWQMLNVSQGDNYNVVEVLTLPSAPELWSVGDETLISEDRRQAFTRTQVRMGERLESRWEITEGDPTGEYRLDIFVEGKLTKTHRFDVVEPALLIVD